MPERSGVSPFSNPCVAKCTIRYRPNAGLLATYLREVFNGDPTFFGARCVLTIHNLGYQGDFPPSALADVGLSRTLFHPEGLESSGPGLGARSRFGYPGKVPHPGDVASV